jgi:hypothetical protein
MGGFACEVLAVKISKLFESGGFSKSVGFASSKLARICAYQTFTQFSGEL